MSAERIGPDSNVLVYAVDRYAGPRHGRAVELMERALPRWRADAAIFVRVLPCGDPQRKSLDGRSQGPGPRLAGPVSGGFRKALHLSAGSGRGAVTAVGVLERDALVGGQVSRRDSPSLGRLPGRTDARWGEIRQPVRHGRSRRTAQRLTGRRRYAPPEPPLPARFTIGCAFVAAATRPREVPRSARSPSTRPPLGPAARRRFPRGSGR